MGITHVFLVSAVLLVVVAHARPAEAVETATTTATTTVSIEIADTSSVATTTAQPVLAEAAPAGPGVSNWAFVSGSVAGLGIITGVMFAVLSGEEVDLRDEELAKDPAVRRGSLIRDYQKGAEDNAMARNVSFAVAGVSAVAMALIIFLVDEEPVSLSNTPKGSAVQVRW